jgi:hypothetical protein
MRSLDFAFTRQISERGRIVAQDSVGKAKKTAECRRQPHRQASGRPGQKNGKALSKCDQH